jgi:hypothetical protein
LCEKKSQARDDKGKGELPWKVVSGLGPATTLYGAVALSFVIPSEAEGSAVSTDLSWKCFLCCRFLASLFDVSVESGIYSEGENDAIHDADDP